MSRRTPADSASAEPTETTSSESTASSTESPTQQGDLSQEEVGPDEGRIPRVVVGIDPSVEQGNRVALSTPNLQSDPIGDLKNRIKEHFDDAMVVTRELRANLAELDALLNKVRTGL